MTRRAILNVAVGHWYPEGQERLWYSLEDRGANATRLFWRDEYPPGSPSQEEALYAFKIHAFEHARRLGFDQAVWVDASCWAVRDLGEIWARIDRDGYYLEPDGNPVGPWTNDRALELLSLTRDEAMEMPLVEGKLWGLNLRDDTAVALLDELLRLAQTGAFTGSLTNHDGSQSSDSRCHGHRGDISVLSPLADSFGLTIQPFKRVWFPANGEPPAEAVMLSQGM